MIFHRSIPQPVRLMLLTFAMINAHEDAADHETRLMLYDTHQGVANAASKAHYAMFRDIVAVLDEIGDFAYRIR